MRMIRVAALCLSVLLCATAAALRFRSAAASDVWKISAVGRCLLLRSNGGRWVEISYVSRGWADGGVGWWSVERRAGRGAERWPIIFDYNVTRRARTRIPPFPGEYGYGTGELWVMRGPDGRPLYEQTDNYNWMGMAWSSLASRPHPTYWLIVPATTVWMPFSAIAVAAAVAPALSAAAWSRRRIRAWRRARAARRGRCVRCGYDLRGSAGRCPECGEPIDETPRSHAHSPGASAGQPVTPSRASSA